MKNLFYIFFAIVSLIITPNAKADCTDVSVTYQEGKPKDPLHGKPSLGNELTAYHITRCGQETEDYYFSFMPDNPRVSIQNGTPLRLATPQDGFFYAIDIPKEDITGGTVNVVCTCDHGICGNCALVSPQNKHNLKGKRT